MRVYLIGFMGSGKSTTAKGLARALGYSHIDLDRYIEAQEGQSIPSIFESRGQSAFRELESKYLREIADDNIVIATGGGTPCSQSNMEYMNSHGVTLYLRHSVAQLSHRLSQSKVKRPLLMGKNREEIEEFIAEVLPQRELYYNLSSIIVDNPSRDISSIVQIVKLHPDYVGL